MEIMVKDDPTLPCGECRSEEMPQAEACGETTHLTPKCPRVYIRTFGCQMNARDSELVAGMLREKGYEMTENMDEAGIILFNTCSVRQHAEDRVTGMLHKLKTRRKNNPDLRIGVIGCMAQRHGEMLFKEYPEVDIVVGPSNIYDIAELMPQAGGRGKILAVDKKARPHKKIKEGRVPGAFSAFVNIMYGCENFCSYCIVPYVRGKETSRPKNDIIAEVKDLADRGFREITLLGQNVNSYGKNLTNRITFPELLEEVNGVAGIERIRFVTSHPKDADKSLFRAIKDLSKVCEHIHLPLQSGSDKMLDLMNRKYTFDEYLKKAELLRGMIPGVGITTDIIVGFPSEKDRDYKATYKAMEEIAFNSAFIFKYSPRPPALSSYLADDVPEDVKKDRNNALLELQKEISHGKNKELIGTEQEVLVEGKSRMSDKELMGRTRNNTPCVFAGGDELVGKVVRVRIKGTSVTTLKGEAADGGPVVTEAKG